MKMLCAYAAIVCIIASAATAGERVWQEVDLRGIYVFGHATNTLTPCSSGQPMWLDGAGKASEDLHAAYDSSVAAHFDPLYVVVRGRLDAEYDTGDYWLGLFKIEELIDYSADPQVIAECQSEAANK